MLGAAPPDPFLLAAEKFGASENPDVELARECLTDLRTFVREAWPLLEPMTPFVDGWHSAVMAEHLQAVSHGELLRLIINIPPRLMKSLMCCVFWPAWEWMDKPHLRWLFATYADLLSQRDSVKMRNLLRSTGNPDKLASGEGTLFERYGYQGVRKLLGLEPWGFAADQDAKGRYDNTATGFRLATSVKGMGTGEGGDRIVVDDPLNAKQARSDADRNFVNVWWDETMTTRFNNAKAAGVIVMQRLHEDDLTGHLIERGGWHHLCLPAQYEPKHPFVYPKTVKLDSGRVLQGDRRTKPGQLLEPERLGVEKLRELLKDQGSYAFAGQQQQRPAPSEGGMFKAGWWKRYDEIPPQWQTVVASWDMRFSDSQKASSSYVVGQVWGVNGSQRYLLGQIRGKLSFTQSVKAVKALKEWMPQTGSILVEEKANGAAVIDTLKSKVPGLTPIQPEGGKDVRAAAAEPFVEAGDIFIPAGQFIPAPPGYEPTPIDEFIGEFSVFPNGANDDQVDAATQAINWLGNKRVGVTTQSYMPNAAPSVIRHGDLELRGDHHIDKP